MASMVSLTGRRIMGTGQNLLGGHWPLEDPSVVSAELRRGRSAQYIQCGADRYYSTLQYRIWLFNAGSSTFYLGLRIDLLKDPLIRYVQYCTV